MENQVVGAITALIKSQIKQQGFDEPEGFFNFQSKENGGVFTATAEYFLSDEFVVREVPTLLKRMPPNNCATFTLTDPAHRLAVGYVYYQVAKDSPDDLDFYKSIVFADEKSVYDKRQKLENLFKC